MSEPIERPSPNHDERRRPVSMVVLHYTDMLSAEAAIERLCDPEAKVSCHYLVTKTGEVVRMVPEERRAWHAGRSYWRGISDVNDDSIGIEIDNPGHLNGYEPFPDAQIDALIPLLSGIMLRHRITRGNVVGHSDVAPARKRDPGELFPWGRLARMRLALPRPTRNLMDPQWTDAGFLLALERFGYDVSDKMAAIVAFQRRFRPELIDGEIDGECRSILLALLLPKPQGDD
jgi:N-acetylmuramoyl-L-alanine amidase